MPELSVIIPYVNEWPQVAFTIRSISEDLKDRVDFEIIAVDNFSTRYMKNTERDRGSRHIKRVAELHPWLRYELFDKKLSHWNAKNYAIEHSNSPFLMFIDAHCVTARNSLFDMFQLYKDSWESLGGSIHLPLMYHILENRLLKYALTNTKTPYAIHYKFVDHFPNEKCLQEVPCMSTCGMLIHRSYLSSLGLWPTELGVYGGGENFINFVGAVCGLRKWLFTNGVLYHHGEKRGYKWNDKDFLRNRAIAVYLYGGYDMAKRFCLEYPVPNNIPAYPTHILYQIFSSVVDSCEAHRDFIKDRQKLTIQDWISQWI
jgi:glycosyltransferase involved in cell wall biosynthesis